MKIICDEPFCYIYLEEGNRCFLCVPCAASAVSFDFYLEMTDVEKTEYLNKGTRFLSDFASRIQNSSPKFKDFNKRRIDEDVKKRIDDEINISGKRTML